MLKARTTQNKEDFARFELEEVTRYNAVVRVYGSELNNNVDHELSNQCFNLGIHKLEEGDYEGAWETFDIQILQNNALALTYKAIILLRHDNGQSQTTENALNCAHRAIDEFNSIEMNMGCSEGGKELILLLKDSVDSYQKNFFFARYYCQEINKTNKKHKSSDSFKNLCDAANEEFRKIFPNENEIRLWKVDDGRNTARCLWALYNLENGKITQDKVFTSVFIFLKVIKEIKDSSILLNRTKDYFSQMEDKMYEFSQNKKLDEKSKNAYGSLYEKFIVALEEKKLVIRPKIPSTNSSSKNNK